MTFDKALQFIFSVEGGFVDNPRDPGGVTNMGISKRQYPNVDIPNLTREQAAEIYRQDYWDKCLCDELPNGLDLLMLDCAANQGQPTAVRLLQKALKLTNVDGIMGPETVEAVRQNPGIIAEFLGQRMYAYSLVPQVLTMGLGWYRRLAKAAQAAFQL